MPNRPDFSDRHPSRFQAHPDPGLGRLKPRSAGAVPAGVRFPPQLPIYTHTRHRWSTTKADQVLVVLIANATIVYVVAHALVAAGVACP